MTIDEFAIEFSEYLRSKGLQYEIDKYCQTDAILGMVSPNRKIGLGQNKVIYIKTKSKLNNIVWKNLNDFLNLTEKETINIDFLPNSDVMIINGFLALKLI